MEPARTAYIYLGDELRSLADRVAALERASLASWHELALADSYDTGRSPWGTDPDLAAYLTARLGAPAYVGSWLRPQMPTITVGPHTWSATDADHIRTTTADVIVTFGDGSSLTRAGVSFTNVTRPNARLYGVRLGSTGAHVNTGLTMDYGYEFRVRGYTQGSTQSALLSAHTSTSERTSLRLLGGSNYFQHQWPSNQDVRNSGIDVRSMLEYAQNKDGVSFVQGENTYNFAYTGTQSGTGTAEIWLLNDAYNSTYGNGVLAEAEISDGDGNILRHFEPWYWDSEIVLIDTANNNQVYRPSSGALVEVAAP